MLPASVLLPHAERAYVDLRKLAEYCLSPEHPVGAHKALLFKRVLGLTATDAQPFRKVLLWTARCAEACPAAFDEFGRRYTIDFTLATPAGSAAIPSAWIVRSGEDFPRFTTCFMLPR